VVVARLAVWWANSGEIMGFGLAGCSGMELLGWVDGGGEVYAE
jgi:hypothetical protein